MAERRSFAVISKFEEIKPSDITIWVNPVTNRITAKVYAKDGEFHEITFPNEQLNMRRIIDALKEDLRDYAVTAPQRYI